MSYIKRALYSSGRSIIEVSEGDTRSLDFSSHKGCIEVTGIRD